MDIQPPPDIHRFDLGLYPEDDTIVIFNPTEFFFNIDTHGLEIKEMTFSTSSKTWDIQSGENSFLISPEELIPGYDTLALTIYTNSSTGSIADIVGGEGYLIEKKWPILVDGRTAPVIKPRKSITNDGYLQISWPKCDQFNFHSYEIAYNMNGNIRSWKTTNVNDTSFVDSSYVGLYAYVTIDTRVLTGNNLTNGYTLSIDEQAPKMNFEDIGLDSLKIFWNRCKYRCSYKLTRRDVNPKEVIVESTDDTVCVIPHPGIGQRSEFVLETYPYQRTESNDEYMVFDSQYHAFGKSIASNWPNYAYNQVDKVVYTSTYDDIECYDAYSTNLIKSFKINNLIYRGLFSCQSASTKVAAISSSDVNIFTDKSLINPVSIPYDSRDLIDHFFLTENNLIAIATPNRYDLVSIDEKQVIASFEIEDYPEYSKWACFATSNDGRYACVVTYNGINIFNIQGGSVTKSYTDNKAYRSVIFSLSNPDQLLLTYKDDRKLEIRNVSDFSLVRTINLPTPSQVLQNIDPESGYLLTTDYDFLYIMDLTSTEMLLKIKCNKEYKARLYNNRLYTVYGYTIDISEYLPQ